mgnify:CR=1 FL=1
MLVAAAPRSVRAQGCDAFVEYRQPLVGSGTETDRGSYDDEAGCLAWCESFNAEGSCYQHTDNSECKWFSGTPIDWEIKSGGDQQSAYCHVGCPTVMGLRNDSQVYTPWASNAAKFCYEINSNAWDCNTFYSLNAGNGNTVICLPDNTTTGSADNLCDSSVSFTCGLPSLPPPSPPPRRRRLDTAPPPASPAGGAVLLYASQQCSSAGNTNLGVFASVLDCLWATQLDGSCPVPVVMWSDEYHEDPIWGCWC